MKTVGEVALAWWAEKQKNIFPHQCSYYQNFLEHYILRFLGKEAISGLTSERLDAYFAQLLFEQQYRTALERKEAAYGKSILQEIFDYAETNGYANGLPKAELTYRINQKKREDINGCSYSEETIRQIRKFIVAEMAEPVGLAMGLAWYAGLNREEILSLTHQDIDFKNGYIRVGERIVPLEKPLEGMLLEYKDWKSSPANQYIFVSRKKTRFAGPSMSLLVKNGKERYGIEDPAVNLNGLRNNYILRKLESIRTEDLPVLAESLGVSPIWLLSSFAYYLTPAEKQFAGVNAFYQRSEKYLDAQIEDDAAKAVNNVIWSIIAKELGNGTAVSLGGFGLFYIKQARVRYERNWLTLEFFKVKEERQLAFVPYPNLLISINFEKE